MKYFIRTFGCQMNENDSIQAGILLEKELGMKKVNDPKDADVIILNTCSVREKPEKKVFSEAGRIGKLKKKKPNIIFGIMGCVAQEIGKSFLEKLPYLDFVIGTHNIHKLPEIIKAINEKNGKFCETEFYNEIKSINIPTLPYDKFNLKAYVTIMQGCNNFCSYCIVPFVRGREYSRKSEDIINEIKLLAEKGVKEVTLLGQNVNSYGKTREKEISFCELLYKISEIQSIKRIRFTTSHPKDFGDDLIDAFKNLKKLCNHLHLPLQSGSTKILKLMNRKYTKEEYLEKVYKLKEKVPDIAISTDIIVGFPYEEENDFQETLDVMEKVNYITSFSFKYSPRPFSKYEKIDNIPEDVKLERLKILQNLQKKLTLEHNQNAVGKTFEVLVEGFSKKKQLTGRLEDNRIVNFEGDSNLIGKFIKIKITKAFQNSLIGEVVNEG